MDTKNIKETALEDYYARTSDGAPLSGYEVAKPKLANSVVVIDVGEEVKSKELLRGENAMGPVSRFRQNRNRSVTKVKATQKMCETELEILTRRLAVCARLDKARLAVFVERAVLQNEEMLCESRGASRVRIKESQILHAMATLKLMDEQIRAIHGMPVPASEKRWRAAAVIDLCKREYSFLLSDDFRTECRASLVKE